MKPELPPRLVRRIELEGELSRCIAEQAEIVARWDGGYASGSPMYQRLYWMGSLDWIAEELMIREEIRGL